MKAVVVHQQGGPEELSYEEVPDPIPGPGMVRVKIRCAGLNRRDIYARMGQYPRVRFPAIPGSDGAGVVDRVGEGVDSVRVGDEVVLYPALHWGSDERVSARDFEILGIPTDGTYAEYVVAPEASVFPKPGYLSWAEAAALPLVGLTAYRSLFVRGSLQRGEALMVPGIGGGLATMVLLMAVAAEATVSVTSSSEQKLARAHELGAAHGVNYRDADYVAALRHEAPGGFDLIVDTLGGPRFNDLLVLAKPGGRIVLVGATAGPVPELVTPRVFLKHLSLVGTTMGSPQDFARMLDFCMAHAIHPVVDRVFPLAEVRAAQDRLYRGDQFGKVVLEVAAG
jgi:zinc-binding alcohol dehydrogenase/oxidoreductase